MTDYFPYLTILHIFADSFEISAFINLLTFASLKSRQGSVSNALLLNTMKIVSSIISEVKNMLDYKVGHYIHPNELTYEQRKNIL